MEIKFKLLANTEKIIDYMNRQLPNFPKKEIVLKNNIEKNKYEIIKNVFDEVAEETTSFFFMQLMLYYLYNVLVYIL